MRLRLNSMTAGLAAGICLSVGLASAAGAYLFSIHHFDSLVETARANALARGQLIRAALEHQMMEKDRSLIQEMTRTFGSEADVENVLILDRFGRVRYASGETAERQMDLSSPTCQACHQLPPEQRQTSRIIETRAGTMLRTVIPLLNRPRCHRCHDPNHKINGILIVDLDAGQIRASMNRDLRWLTAGTVVVAVALMILLALLFRVVVTRRLRRFETTARQIAAGDLERRVPAEGTDTIAWLGREFNTMADSMTRLLKKVGDQREQLETVINGIDDGIVVLDPDRRIVAANDAFLRRRGRTRASLVGTACNDPDGGTCGAGDCPTAACLRLERNQVRICERHTPEGEVIWEEVHASPIRREDGRIAQVVEVWRDISERRSAEARLAESHRLASLGMLASGFSHELSTPLATTLTCVEGIQRTVGKDGSTSETLGAVAESAAIAREQLLRCRGITQHFLRLSRGQGSATEWVDLAATVAAVTRLIGPTARAHGVRVEVGDVPSGLHVRAHEADLQHVLLNLLLNGIQACESRGTVRLEVEPGDPVRVRVTDDGSGIAPTDLARIFEPFFSRRRGGTGLGLFLAQDFARKWGGEITVRSAPGSGSTFEVRLPSSDDQARQVRPA